MLPYLLSSRISGRAKIISPRFLALLVICLQVLIASKTVEYFFVWKCKFPPLTVMNLTARVKGLNKSNISYLINTVMAEFKCLRNSSYLGLVYTWNFKGAIDLLFLASGYNKVKLLCCRDCISSYQKWAKRFIQTQKALDKVKEA